uniref:Fibrinogen C-terminal domain-containing protein n=1 Tax=Anopheles farauti TaxID=69004 RepID=A0A182QF69_9DIPT
MAAKKNLLVLVLVLSVTITLCNAEDQQYTSCGFGLEMLLAKLDAIEEKIISLEQRLEGVRTVESRNSNFVPKDGSPQKEANVDDRTEIVPYFDNVSTEHSVDVMTDRPVKSKAPQYPIGIEPTAEQLRYGEDSIYSSCREVPSRTSGKFLIRPSDDDDRLMNLLCDMQSIDAGWIVVQNRFNGSESFYRGWKDYEAGFGNLDGEFWLGLERISSIVNNGRQWEILFWLKNYQGLIQYSKFTKFLLGNATEGYRLKFANGYTGNAGDSISRHVGMKFTTYDRDNDPVPYNCAKKHRGGWWYHNTCITSNLNGMYGNMMNEQSIKWSSMKPIGGSLQASRIMIREVI